MSFVTREDFNFPMTEFETELVNRLLSEREAETERADDLCRLLNLAAHDGVVAAKKIKTLEEYVEAYREGWIKNIQTFLKGTEAYDTIPDLVDAEAQRLLEEDKEDINKGLERLASFDPEKALTTEQVIEALEKKKICDIVADEWKKGAE